LLQPLVENSIKHGLEPHVAGGTITVQARRNGDTLLLEVTDTGRGFDLSSPPGNGFGIAQVRERLHATYAELAHLTQLAPASGGSMTRLQLPISVSLVAA
jgi:LytS/YehU family sensor histidine kinase